MSDAPKKDDSGEKEVDAMLFCPMMKDFCLRYSCAFFNDMVEKCSIWAIANSLDKQTYIPKG